MKQLVPHKTGRLLILGLVGIIVLGLVVYASTKASTTQGDQRPATQARPRDFAAVCPPGAPIPASTYDLGSAFAGLPRTSQKDLCVPPPPHGIAVDSGPSVPVGYRSVVYGSCRRISDAGCFPPLNVQSWPECARNPASYGNAPTPGERRGDRHVLLSEPLIIPGATWLPARSFEAGRRQEIYAGDTTIVVFSVNRHLADAAVSALAAKVTREAAPSSAADLQTKVRLPGDATTCRYRQQKIKGER